VSRSRLLLREPDPGSKAIIFAIPYSGAGASMYRQWPRFIGDAEVCPLHLPGRERLAGEPHYGDFRTLAALLASELLPWCGTVPVAAFGHCSSALIGYEFGRALWSAHRIPLDCLFASSEAPPHMAPYGRIFAESEATLTAEVRESLGHPQGKFGERLVAMTVAALIADVEAHRAYRGSPPAVPGDDGVRSVTVLAWANDEQFPPSVMADWSDYAPARLARLDGGHHSFRDFPPGLAQVLAAPFTGPGVAAAAAAAGEASRPR
jgi:surfactin synthase thioesterase subunit